MIGALIVDKPEGSTSHDVVSRIRRLVETRRVGHTGTLDPFATGVLVICIGQATRLAQFLIHLPKEYIATVRLGFATDTQDLTGQQISPLVSSKEVSLDGLHRVLSEFIGIQLQTPPMFSAKKVAGERLYRAARAGRDVERKPVEIQIYSIELTVLTPESPGGFRDFEMRVRCSAGTYVRTLAHDIGNRLGVGAHLAALRRTGVGHFNISSALTLEQIEERRGSGSLAESLITPAEMLSHLPSIRLEAERVRQAGHGRAIALNRTESKDIEGSGPVRVCDQNGGLIAVARYDNEQEVLRPLVVMSRECK